MAPPPQLFEPLQQKLTLGGHASSATTNRSEMTLPEADRANILAMFGEIRSMFPSLHADLVVEHPHVDLWMDIPAQPGLSFAVNLNLQHDELHLSAGAFWLEWFPCTKPGIVSAYRDAVTGLLHGEYRIVEYYAGKRAVRAELQRPAGTTWEGIGVWCNGFRLFSWRNAERILQNRPAT